MREILFNISTTEKQWKRGKHGERKQGRGYWSAEHEQHSSAETAKHIFPEYYSFAFVRNPYDWVVSSYLKAKKDGMNVPDSFDKWVEDGCQCAATYRKQSEYLYDSEGNLLVDFIGKYESIKEDWSTLARKLDFPDHLPHLNQGYKHDYKEFYENPNTKATVEQKFADDILLFSYTF